jgi:transposase
MFIQRTQRKSNGKVYKSVALIENYRDNGKVRHRTIASLTKWPEKIVNDLGKLLKGESVIDIEDLNLSVGKSFGAIQSVKEIAGKIGITQALGTDKRAKLALLQIAGRIISQGSRNYIANEWVKNQDINKVFGIDNLNEDQLYRNLIWLSENQEKIEKKIFSHRYKNEKIKSIFLYDVTSSYLEGEKNELAEYGYNRDKKKGKKQIVVGLMLDSYGYPLSVEVFKGNTSDTKTVSSQLKKLRNNFGVEQVIFVGDKGMIKSAQIDEIISKQYKWGYLTTITKEQIKSLINQGVLQLSLFEDEIIEIEGENDVRYILRKNNYRAEEINKNRESKIQYIKEIVLEKNKYLTEHKKANVDKAKNKIEEIISDLRMASFLTIEQNDREFIIKTDEQKKDEAGELDGCYVVKTQVSKKELSTQEAHDRYKDLSMVEFAFRTMKTTLEELRPIYVWKEKQTRGHVFVVMLAYMISKYITDKTKELGFSRKFVLETLDKIHYVEHEFKGQVIKTVPKILSEEQTRILDAIGVKLKVAKDKS